MKPYEFSRFYYPRLGKFVYRHKGSGVIIDNIFKPMKAIASSLFKKAAKPMAKKHWNQEYHMLVIELVKK